MAKAEAAEQKAGCAKDATAREQAWREAGRQWDRAADREQDDKRRRPFAEKAEAARAKADATRGEDATPVILTPPKRPGALPN